MVVKSLRWSFSYLGTKYVFSVLTIPFWICSWWFCIRRPTLISPFTSTTSLMIFVTNIETIFHLLYLSALISLKPSHNLAPCMPKLKYPLISSLYYNLLYIPLSLTIFIILCERIKYMIVLQWLMPHLLTVHLNQLIPFNKDTIFAIFTRVWLIIFTPFCPETPFWQWLEFCTPWLFTPYRYH